MAPEVSDYRLVVDGDTLFLVPRDPAEPGTLALWNPVEGGWVLWRD